ncbi:MAG: 16S rRNA (cytosine(1402)-N(4))-methyltransferase RsmH [Anaerorhabdus sp.]
MEHKSVLLQECIEGLKIQQNGIYVDGTLGRGGHSIEIAKKLANGHLYCFDKDEQALMESKKRLQSVEDRVTLIHHDFKNMKEVLKSYGVEKVDGILLDLGVSSPQFDDEDRGFSYRFDSDLDMRMDQRQKLSAYDVVNSYSYHDLVRIFFNYGEEKFAKQIARMIEKKRVEQPIKTTLELVDVIKSALPMKVLSKKGHPAKQVFQAIRIEVNGELDALKTGLQDALELLNSNGRCAVITFHSLEDRMVKEMFNAVSKAPIVDRRIPLRPDQIEKPQYHCVNKRPQIASEEEMESNRRATSAKLRVIERE